MSDTEKMEAMRKHLLRCADQLEYWKTNIPLHDDGNTEWCAKRARELAGEEEMTDTKDATQVLQDAGWLVVEPGGFIMVGEKYGEAHVVTYEVAGCKFEPDQETPDTIDWSHVDPKYRYMARDDAGQAFVFKEEPKINDYGGWSRGGGLCPARVFASYRRGTVPWDKSLVCREDEE